MIVMYLVQFFFTRYRISKIVIIGGELIAKCHIKLLKKSSYFLLAKTLLCYFEFSKKDHAFFLLAKTPL